MRLGVDLELLEVCIDDLLAAVGALFAPVSLLLIHSSAFNLQTLGTLHVLPQHSEITLWLPTWRLPELALVLGWEGGLEYDVDWGVEGFMRSVWSYLPN